MALTRKERTLGCLWAMACGDALGVPSSFLTPEQIQSKYGWIDTFYPPERDTFSTTGCSLVNIPTTRSSPWH